MIQSAANQASVPNYGFGNLARFRPKNPKEGTVESGSAKSSSSATIELTPDAVRQVQRLKQTDREVRAHEQAHLSVGADLVRGGASFTYELGPDKKRYAVGGEVSIDTSPGRTPEETIPKAQHIRATALAPANPSPQDHSVAAHASQMESSARIELAAQQSEERAVNPVRSANTDSGGSRLYLSVAQSDGGRVQPGGRLDVFA